MARAAREHPILLAMLRDGRLHLSGIRRLAPHLTRANREALLKRATHKSRRQIEELVAELAPRPDAPTEIRRLPAPRGPSSSPTGSSGPGATAAPPAGWPAAPDTAASASSVSNLQLGPDPVVGRPDVARPRQAQVEPLAPERYKVQFTASAGLRARLEQLQALMRTSVPDGDLATLVELAVTEKIERLEALRFGRVKVPRKGLADTDTTPSSRHIPAPVRRVVHERDEGQCTYLDARGRRCRSRERLEFHHRRPFARGGGHSPENLVLVCRAHNAQLAEQDYGTRKMARCRHAAGRVSEPTAVWGPLNDGTGAPTNRPAATARSPGP